MRWIVRDKSFYRALVALAVPICFQNALTYGVALADNGYLEYAVNYIEGSDDENAISLLLDKALEANNWDLIDKLNELI